MNIRSSSAASPMPGEYRKAAERLFPKDGFSRRHKIDVKSAAEFAKALGIGMEFQRFLALDKNSNELRSFLGYFQSNLDLLIQKTWVEKSDERRKEKLQSEIPSFMSKIEKEDYCGAIRDFGAILEELAFLFFGAQSEKDDFTEYTFRIDAQMGLFWWYGTKLALIKELCEKNIDFDKKILWAVLLLGICYLTNF